MQRKWWISAVVIAVAILTVLVFGVERGSAPTFVLFVGRFHPTIVHFPIAFLILAILIEGLAPRSSYVAGVRSAVPFILLLGALSALAAVTVGYLLSLGGGYDEDLLSVHMWLGLAVMVFAFVLSLISMWNPSPGPLFRGSLFALGILVVVAGHLGGSLARGGGYLTYYLPEPVKAFVGLQAGTGAGLITNIDSALVYVDLVQPIFDRRCVKCHGAGKSKGDLRLDSWEGVEEGGRDGVAVVAGNPSQSEITRRITLPPFDEDAMPPDGEAPLDVGETEVIRWWIANGASPETKVAQIEEMPSAVETYLRRVSAPRVPERSGIYALDVPFADSAALADLRSTGLVISQIDADAPFLLVSAAGLHDQFTDAGLDELRPIADQIAQLDIGHTSVTGAGAGVFEEMPHLTRLHLENTAMDDDALLHLDELEYLEYVNLYGTQVGDGGLQHLSGLETLRSVYLWQTRATEEGARELRSALPEVRVNLGAGFAAMESDSTELAVP